MPERTRSVGTVFVSDTALPALLDRLASQCETLVEHHIGLNDHRHPQDSEDKPRVLRVVVQLE